MSRGLKAVVWKKDKESTSYVFQLSSKSERELNRAMKEIGGKQSGKGCNPSTNQKIFLLEKEFVSKKTWLKFVKSLTFKLFEISPRTGKERIIHEGQKK